MSRGRLLWADAAKGIAVMAVVLVHAQGKHFKQTGWDVSNRAVQAIDALNLALLPIRMPLFFLISGFFAARAVQRSWRTVLAKKTLHFYYLYLLWLAIQTALLQLAPRFDTEIANGPLEFLAQATVAPSNLWYLYALAVYFPLAKLGARAPRASLAVATVLSGIAVTGVLPHWGDLPAIPQNLVWFLAGCYLSPLVQRLAEQTRLWIFVCAVVFFGITSVTMAWLGHRDPALYVVASAAGAVLGVVGMAYLVRLAPWAGRAFSYVGRRTLAVYVLQMPLLALWHVTVKDAGVGGLLSRPGLAVLYPFALTVLVTAVAMLIQRLIEPLAPALFDRPRLLKFEREAPAVAVIVGEGMEAPAPKPSATRPSDVGSDQAT